jgi:hypothetical protein
MPNVKDGKDGKDGGPGPGPGPGKTGEGNPGVGAEPPAGGNLQINTPTAPANTPGFGGIPAVPTIPGNTSRQPF